MSVFNSILSSSLTAGSLFICLISALITGVLTALVFSFKNPISKSFALTLVLLPAAMTMVTMMINGNLGVAVAVAGGFTLVRFRSIAGSGREISAVFIVMALGVILGMGYIAVAAIFFAVVALTVILLTALNFGENSNEKFIRITIPEDYNYENLFDDVFEKYGAKAKIEKIKTTNMGSLIDVTYRVSIKNGVSKAMLDDLRVKNSNLSIMVTNVIPERESL